MLLTQKITAAIAKIIRDPDFTVEFSGSFEHGDYSSNVALVLAKKKGKNPKEYAQELVETLQKSADLADFVARIEVAGPGFINFWLREEFLKKNLDTIIKDKDVYGASDLGKGKTMVIDYSSPNIAKSFGIGHLRSTIIGQALYNLYQFLGYKTIGDNHLGDWGTQFGKLLYMIDKEGGSPEISLDWLEKKYVEFHRLAQEDESLEEHAREWFKKLEDKDSQARALWQKCVEVSLSEFNRIYDLLGVKIDYAYGESFYEDLMLEVIAEAKEKGLAKESQGAWVVEAPGSKTPLMLVKKDGATTYAARDLAALKFRQKQWHPDLIIYEVGVEQSLHFSQVFTVARRLGYVGPETELVHTKHGLYTDGRGRKLSTRKGENVKLEEILREAIERAEKLGSSDEETAEQVGIGAVKYFDLKHTPQSNIIFDWGKMFELEGNSGPYLQYTVARALSVLRKATEGKKKESSGDDDFYPEELSVMRTLTRFHEIIVAAAKTYSPSVLCEYLFDLAQKFNTFYNKHKVIGSESEEFRLILCSATAQVLENGLKILGIATPQKM